MIQPGRKYASSSSKYRYGFNGKEQDNELKGEGAQYDYGFRIYDSRIGRFLSVDPLSKSYPWYTPFQFSGNKPIIAIDLDGLEERVSVTAKAYFKKPVTQLGTAFSAVDKVNVHAAGINFIMSKLLLKEVQQKELVGPPPGMNREFNGAYLTKVETEEIIKETINQFTIQISNGYSQNTTLDQGQVTEFYTINFDFNYSLFDEKSSISEIKEIVSKTLNVAYVIDDLSCGKFNKLGNITLAGKVLTLNEQALLEVGVGKLAEKIMSNKNSVLTSLFKSSSKKVAGKLAGVISLSLTNSGPQSNIDAREAQAQKLKARTIAALLTYFLTGNKPVVRNEILPVYSEKLPIPGAGGAEPPPLLDNN